MNEPSSFKRSDPASEADAWMVILAERRIPRATRMAFVRWLKRSPVHVEEFLRVASIRSLLRAHVDAEVNGSGVDSQRSGNVIPWPWHRQKPSTVEMSGSSRSPWISMTIAAALVVAFAGLGVQLFSSPTAVIRAATTHGEIRDLILPDGSRLVLNTDSSVTVTFQRASRVTTINHGQVFIDVAADRSRPFKVVSRDAVLTDIGTKFDVYVRPRDTVLTVLDGRVAVAPPGSAQESNASITGNSSTPITAGQRATMNKDGHVIRIDAVKPQAATSWQQRRLEFDDMSLGEISREFNRYNSTQIDITDARVANVHFSGTFATTDPNSFLATVERLPHVEVEWLDASHAKISHKPP